MLEKIYAEFVFIRTILYLRKGINSNTLFMRKTLKYSCLSLIMTISLCACPTEPDIDRYNLALHFRDASGKDLTKGIELEEWSYGESIETADWGGDTFRFI